MRVIDPLTDAFVFRETFDVFSVEIPEVAVPVVFSVEIPEVAVPVELPAFELADLDIEAPTVSATEVEPGDTVAIDMPFSNAGRLTPDVYLSALLLDPDEVVVARVDQPFSPAAGAVTTQRLSWTVPATAKEGPYELVVQVSLTTPTGVLVLQETFDVFVVSIPALPAVAIFEMGDLQVTTPTVSADVVTPGDTVTIDIPFSNLVDMPSPTLHLDMPLMAPSGAVVEHPSYGFSLGAGKDTIEKLTWTVPATAVEGDYELLVRVMHPTTGVLFIDERIEVFSVEIPEAAVPTLALTPTLIRELEYIQGLGLGEADTRIELEMLGLSDAQIDVQMSEWGYPT